MSCPTEEDLVRHVADRGEAAVREHLAGCADCRDRLASLSRTRDLFADLREELRAASVPSGVPAQVGPYRVLARIGEEDGVVELRGGHALVEEDVVLYLATPDAADRLDPDALLTRSGDLAGIDHAGLERLLGLDFHEGRPFVAAALVPGRRLAERMAEDGRGEGGWRRRCAASVADAVAALHERGVCGFRIAEERVRCGGDDGPFVLTGWSADVLLRASPGYGPADDLKGLRALLRRLLPGEDVPEGTGAATLAARLHPGTGARRRILRIALVLAVLGAVGWLVFGVLL